MEIMLGVIGRQRLSLPLPWGLASLIGTVGDAQGFLRSPLPMLPPPQLTSDQVKLLRVDNIAAAGAPGLAALGSPRRRWSRSSRPTSTRSARAANTPTSSRRPRRRERTRPTSSDLIAPPQRRL